MRGADRCWRESIEGWGGGGNELCGSRSFVGLQIVYQRGEHTRRSSIDGGRFGSHTEVPERGWSQRWRHDHPRFEKSRCYMKSTQHMGHSGRDQSGTLFDYP